MQKKYIGYYRVSTEEQGKSGLGLEAQKTSVLEFIRNNGELVAEFQDIESGASENRMGMMEAILKAKDEGATIVVKEISRISRGGFKYRQMMEEYGIDFVECSSPYDPDIVKDIKFSLAKEERSKIKVRVKDALGEIKKKLERGEQHVSKTGNIVTSLGKPENLTDKSRERSIEVRKKQAMEHPNNVKATAFIIELAKDHTFKAITQKLNKAGFKTSRGNDFSEMQTKRLYNRHVESVLGNCHR